eukprot:TRINITY_DN5418_c0_g1_i1.p1 TRINITY_DN5418_c0_g1~~TRINITY_DN5418_c0_g1_i1.p1  ORF type:complete len:590 (+),score=151.79 TRINITY_DN5418_c0_g1_i1:1162-2931(+)
MQSLFDSFRENTTICSTLEELGLSGNKMEELAAFSFRDWIQSNRSLVIKTLRIAGADFREMGLVTCAKTIAEIKSLEELDFSRNPFGELNYLSVADMLLELPNLRTVSLAKAGLVVSWLFPVLSQLRNKAHPLHLNLSGNLLGHDIQLAAFAKELGNLKINSLNLSDTNLGSAGLAEVLPCLPQVTVLIINRVLTSEALSEQLLIDFVNRQTGLRVLHMIGDHPSNLSRFWQTLQSNTTIEELVLERLNLGDGQIYELAEVLRLNKSLRFLSLDRNKLTLAGLQMLEYALRHNSTLLEIKHPHSDLSKILACDDSLKDRIQEVVFSIHLHLFMNRQRNTTSHMWWHQVNRAKRTYEVEWKPPVKLEESWDRFIPKTQSTANPMVDGTTNTISCSSSSSPPPPLSVSSPSPTTLPDSTPTSSPTLTPILSKLSPRQVSLKSPSMMFKSVAPTSPSRVPSSRISLLPHGNPLTLSRGSHHGGSPTTPLPSTEPFNFLSQLPTDFPPPMDLPPPGPPKDLPPPGPPKDLPPPGPPKDLPPPGPPKDLPPPGPPMDLPPIGPSHTPYRPLSRGPPSYLPQGPPSDLPPSPPGS